MGRPQRHSWDLTPRQAIALQQELRDQVRRGSGLRLGQVKTIAGADCAYDKTGGYGYAGVVMYRYPELQELQRVGRRRPLTFPYIPGLLSFREAPLLLAALEKLDHLPDVVIFDGHGYAHPRRFGIASHMGLLLGRPTIGCAKSRLVGEHRMPGRKPGSTTPLLDDDEVIGQVLRSKRGCKPIFISVGHGLDLPTATQIILRCIDDYRVPKPTRDADAYVAKLKAQLQR